MGKETKKSGLSSLLAPLNMKLSGWPHQDAPAGLAKRSHYLIIWISKPSNGFMIWDTGWSSAFIIAGCRASFQCSMSWPVKKKRNASKYFRGQTERNSELCKLIEQKPGKVNETPGSRGREKTPENEKTAAGKAERPWCDLNFKAKNARKKLVFCKFLAFLHKKFRTAILSKLPS